MELIYVHSHGQFADIDNGSGFPQHDGGLKLWMVVYWVHEQGLVQLQEDQLKKVSRKHVGLVGNKE